MRNTRTRLSPFKLIALLITLAIASIGTAVSAQDADTYALGVVVVNCDVNPPAQITIAEEGCAPGDGIEITATDSTSNVIATCIADIAEPGESFTAGCSLDIPYGSTVTVTQNMATIPAGYAPIDNAQEFTAPNEPPTGFLGGPIFVNMLQEGAESVVDSGTEVATDGLPETGSGPSQPVITVTIGGMLAAGLVLMGAAAISLRWGHQHP